MVRKWEKQRPAPSALFQECGRLLAASIGVVGQQGLGAAADC